MKEYPILKITPEKLIEAVYFAMQMFRSDSIHLQGTSTKRDLIGGYIDRWINKVAERIIFDWILEERSYSAVTDYFLYRNSEANAPDILGLKKDDGKVLPFVHFDKDRWASVPAMPRIEVKVLRKDQQLMGIREPQMIDDYYVFIESDIAGDYLTTLFEEQAFDDAILSRLAMPDEFIKDNSLGNLVDHFPMRRNSIIGTLRLIGTYSTEGIRNNTTLCAKQVSPYYFDNAMNTDNPPKQQSRCGKLVRGDDGLFRYSPSRADQTVYLPIIIDSEEKEFKVIKRFKTSVHFHLKKPARINGMPLVPGTAKITFKKFDRSSSWDENIATQYVFTNTAKDETLEMLKVFDQISRT